MARISLAVALLSPLALGGCSAPSTSEGDPVETGCAPCDRAVAGPPALFINELQASNATTVADEGGSYPDWIELYSGLDEDVDLSGYTISDDLAEPAGRALDGLVLPARGFLVLWADGGEGGLHLGFSLEADGEAIGLYDPEGRPLDRVTYEAQSTDWSAARVPDGAESWVATRAPTPGEANVASE